MRRRPLLVGAGTVVAAALAGCLGDDSDENGDDENGDNGDDGDVNSGDGNGNGDDGNDGNGTDGGGNGDNGTGDDNTSNQETVAYEDLTETDREFIDAAADGRHEVQQIYEGGEGIYVESTADGWVELDDPLVPENLSDDLQALVDRDAHLEMHGTTYWILMDLGHDFYGETYELASENECEGDPKPIEDATDEERELLDALLDSGEISIANQEYEAVSGADFFIESDRSLRWFLAETFVEDGRCLDADGEVYGVMIVNEFMREPSGYMLEAVDE